MNRLTIQDTNWCLESPFLKNPKRRDFFGFIPSVVGVSNGIPKVIWAFIPSQMWNIVSVMSSHLMPWHLSSTLEVNDSTSITRLLSRKWSWNVNKNSDLEFEQLFSKPLFHWVLWQFVWGVTGEHDRLSQDIQLFHIYQKAELSMHVEPWIWDRSSSDLSMDLYSFALRHSITNKIIHDTSTHKIPDFSEKIRSQRTGVMVSPPKRHLSTGKAPELQLRQVEILSLAAPVEMVHQSSGELVP